jgi:hypothetical protein
VWHRAGVAKYDPLFEFLCRAGDEPIELRFEEIEALVGPLPPSARDQSGWWSNDATGARHVQAKAWLNAGREVDALDRPGGRVRFSRAGWRRGS